MIMIMIVISDRKHYLYLCPHLCVIYVKQLAVPYSAVLRCPVLWRPIASDTATDRLYTAENCPALHCTAQHCTALLCFATCSRVGLAYSASSLRQIATLALAHRSSQMKPELNLDSTYRLCSVLSYVMCFIACSSHGHARPEHPIPSHHTTSHHTASHPITLHPIPSHYIPSHHITLQHIV